MTCKICGIEPREMWCFGGAWKWHTCCTDFPVCESCLHWAVDHVALLLRRHPDFHPSK